jgi:hypothetical protein
MLIVPIMLYISWLVGNNLWAYIAFGLYVLGAIGRSAKAQAQQKQIAEAAAVTNLSDATTAVNDFIKSLQAKLN